MLGVVVCWVPHLHLFILIEEVLHVLTELLVRLLQPIILVTEAVILLPQPRHLIFERHDGTSALPVGVLALCHGEVPLPRLLVSNGHFMAEYYN